MLIRRADGKVIGELKDKVLEKNVRRSKHFLQVPPAICFDVSIFRDLEGVDVEKYRVTELERNEEFTISVDDFADNAFPVTRGNGPQWGCSLENWELKEKDEETE